MKFLNNQIKYMKLPSKNQVPKQQKLQDLNEIKKLKTNSRLKAINLVLGECLYFKDNYYESERTISKRIGLSPSTVYRAIRDAYNLGLISKRRRFNNSNVYAVNPELRNPKIIDELAGILPALRGILCLIMLVPLVALCKPASSTTSEDLDHLNKKKEILRNIFIVHKSTRYEETYESLVSTRPQRDQKNQESLKRDRYSMENKPGVYGGTKLYDRKTSQYEIDLQRKIYERQRKKYSMQVDDEAQPQYNSKPVDVERKPVAAPYSCYKKYVHYDRPAEDPVKAAENLSAWYESEEFKKFEHIFGREIALTMCNKIVSNAIRENQE